MTGFEGTSENVDSSAWCGKTVVAGCNSLVFVGVAATDVVGKYAVLGTTDVYLYSVSTGNANELIYVAMIEACIVDTSDLIDTSTHC